MTTTLGTFSGDVVIETNDPNHITFTFPIIGTVNPNSPPEFSGFSINAIQAQETPISVTKILSKVTDKDDDPVRLGKAIDPTSAGGATITLSSKGDTILYNPPGALIGADTFTVEVTDGLATIKCTITVLVIEDPAFNSKNPPQLTMEQSGALTIAFTGIPGRNYKILRSTNLVNWTPIATVMASSTGKVTFTDPSPPQPSAFYRITF